MLCSICKKEIIYNLKFEDLFVFKFVCKDCHEMINEKFEIIPIDGGYNLYNYYYMNEEEYNKEFDEFLYPKIIKLVLKNRYKIILFSETEIEPFIPLLMFKKDIIFISNTYTDLIDIFSFYEEEL